MQPKKTDNYLGSGVKYLLPVDPADILKQLLIIPVDDR